MRIQPRHIQFQARRSTVRHGQGDIPGHPRRPHNRLVPLPPQRQRRTIGYERESRTRQREWRRIVASERDASALRNDLKAQRTTNIPTGDFYPRRRNGYLAQRQGSDPERRHSRLGTQGQRKVDSPPVCRT